MHLDFLVSVFKQGFEAIRKANIELASDSSLYLRKFFPLREKFY